jgi:hypothetical protein
MLVKCMFYTPKTSISRFFVLAKYAKISNASSEKHLLRTKASMGHEKPAQAYLTNFEGEKNSTAKALNHTHSYDTI